MAARFKRTRRAIRCRRLRALLHLYGLRPGQCLAKARLPQCSGDELRDPPISIRRPDARHAPSAPFSRENWIFELKYDGFRCLVRKVGSRVELLSRNGKPLNRSFPDGVAAIERLPGQLRMGCGVDRRRATGSRHSGAATARSHIMAMRVRAAAKLHPARLHILICSRRESETFGNCP